jgi:hypothetical protein
MEGPDDTGPRPDRPILCPLVRGIRISEFETGGKANKPSSILDSISRTVLSTIGWSPHRGPEYWCHAGH